MEKLVQDRLKIYTEQNRNEFSSERIKKYVYIIDELYAMGVINIYENIFWKLELQNYDMVQSTFFCSKICVNEQVLGSISEEKAILDKIRYLLENNKIEEEISVLKICTEPSIYELEMTICLDEGENILKYIVNKVHGNENICITVEKSRTFAYNSLDGLINSMRQVIYETINKYCKENERMLFVKFVELLEKNEKFSSLHIKDARKLMQYYLSKCKEEDFLDLIQKEMKNMSEEDLRKIIQLNK